MTLALLDDGKGIVSSAGISGDRVFSTGTETARGTFSARPKGAVGKTFRLVPGEHAVVSFAVAWRFPNQASPIPDVLDKGHYYAERFLSSLAVVEHHAAEHDESHARTRLWHDTWYDSTLPHWRSWRGKSTSTKRTSEQVRRRDGAGRGLDIPARMHG